MLSEKTPWPVRVKTHLSALAWKKITVWALSATIATGGSLLAFGRSAIDYGVRNSESYKALAEQSENTEKKVDTLQRVILNFIDASAATNPALDAEMARRRANQDSADAAEKRNQMRVDGLGRPWR